MLHPSPSLLIDGRRQAGGGAPFRIVDPATGSVLSESPGASVDDIDAAIDAADAAAAGWAATHPFARAKVLRHAAAALRQRSEAAASLITAENGKPLAEARAEVAASAEVLEFYADEATRIAGSVRPGRGADSRIVTVREPVGTVAAFAPWNFPMINIVRKIAPALAAGCAVVAKPAEETPGAPLVLAEVLLEALDAGGHPRGAIGILYGDPAMISSRLIAAPSVRKISFTGSTAVGRQLARLAGEHLKRSTLELGGHAPVIIAPDAHPITAAAMVAAAKFRNAGQTCNSASRFYVHSSIRPAFVAELARLADAVKVGDGRDPETTMGPLSNARRLAGVETHVADALAKGARLVAGGTRLDRPGFFHAPTVLDDVPANARIMQEEPFGPVAPVVGYDTLDEALALANASPFGLAGYVVSCDAPTIRRLTRQMRAGAIGVNTFVVALPEAPFGGLGDSGWGHEGGSEGLDPYLQTRMFHEA